MAKSHLKYKKLTIIQSIEFLATLRDHGIKTACKNLGLTSEEGKYYKRKHEAYSKDKITLAIYVLESQVPGNYREYPFRNYEKQEKCDHKDFKLMLKCTCSKVLSENDLDEIIEICQKKKESLKVGGRVFSLVSDTVVN